MWSGIIRNCSKQRTAKKADFLGFPDRNLNPSQLAERLGVKKQPRAVELERGEANGKITIQSLERAAEALGCRLVYVLVPEKRLADTIGERASLVAERHLAAVEQTMLLEGQAVTNTGQRKESHRRLTRGTASPTCPAFGTSLKPLEPRRMRLTAYSPQNMW